jgi:hypothetical protein
MKVGWLGKSSFLDLPITDNVTRKGLVRIIDSAGEDYLYPPYYDAGLDRDKRSPEVL